MGRGARGGGAFLDDETVREWRRAFAADGSASLGLKSYAPREGHLTRNQETELATLLRADPPRTTGAVRQLIETRFGVTYSTSGAIALMHRLGFCWRKPKHLPLGADEAAQAAHIAGYERLLNALGPDETVVFADAVHPEHQSRPAHGWFPVDAKVALKATSGRQRLNIHVAFNLETSTLTWVEDLQISGETTRRLLEKLERDYSDKRIVHVFLDNARYHHAKALKPWLARPECRIRLHFLPPYAPHLNAIERLWGVLHEHVTHNKCHPTFDGFVTAVLSFLSKTVPQKAHHWRETITDNFRVISPKTYRVIG